MISFRQIRSVLIRVPLLSSISRYIYGSFRKAIKFDSSGSYWEDRYASSGDSGDGSYGRLAVFKAEIINQFVASQSIENVIEFGCGDGAQLALMEYPSYVGVDVSKTIVEKCQRKFLDDKGKEFLRLDAYIDTPRTYDLALSLDVIYHLVEDNVYDDYMQKLFNCSKQWVIIYSSNHDKTASFEHVRHRQFTDWVEANQLDWSLHRKIDQKYPAVQGKEDQTSFADFFIFRRN